MATMAQANGGVQVPTARIAEQSATGFGLAEVVTDIETDQVALCIASNPQLTDYRDASVGEAVALARQVREQADQIEALADEYAEKCVLPALIAKYRIEVEEFDPAVLADTPKLAKAFGGFIEVRGDGTYLVAAPAGQKPSERLDTILALIRWAEARKK